MYKVSETLSVFEQPLKIIYQNIKKKHIMMMIMAIRKRTKEDEMGDKEGKGLCWVFNTQWTDEPTG